MYCCFYVGSVGVEVTPLESLVKSLYNSKIHIRQTCLQSILRFTFTLYSPLLGKFNFEREVTVNERIKRQAVKL